MNRPLEASNKTSIVFCRIDLATFKGTSNNSIFVTPAQAGV